MSKLSLQGIFDMHVHSAPDIRERAYTDFEMMEAGIRVGAKGLYKISPWNNNESCFFS